MLKLQTIASGSKGNCTYVAGEEAEILVDVGLSLPQIEARLGTAGINPDSITGILVTHEHIDHVLGLASFLLKYKNCTLYLHADAESVIIKLLHKNKLHEESRIEIFSKPFKIGDINVNFFPSPHDSAFSFGYTLKNTSAKVSIVTDLGHINSEIIEAMSDSQIVLLESNHDLAKLAANVRYPLVLKRRISGSLGHLSNTAASLAVYELARANVTQIILAHLSEQNNSPTLAYKFVCDFLARKGLREGVDISIDVAQQHEIGKLYTID